jgi:hypothetical protein
MFVSSSFNTYVNLPKKKKGFSKKEFRRLKKEANQVATNSIQDWRVNLLKEEGNDTVQPCDTTQARSELILA